MWHIRHKEGLQGNNICDYLLSIIEIFFMGDGVVLMGRVVHLPKQPTNEIDVVQVSKNRIMVNGVEYESMDLDEFIMSRNVSPEAEEKFIMELFIIIRDYVIADWKIMKIFRDVFKR